MLKNPKKTFINLLHSQKSKIEEMYNNISETLKREEEKQKKYAETLKSEPMTESAMKNFITTSTNVSLLRSKSRALTLVMSQCSISKMDINDDSSTDNDSIDIIIEAFNLRL